MRRRARLLSFSPRRRRAYADQALALFGELTAAIPPDAPLESAVLDASLALVSGTEVVVLLGIDDLPHPLRGQRRRAGRTSWRSRGVAVVLLEHEADQAPDDEAGPVLVGTAGRATPGENGSRSRP